MIRGATKFDLFKLEEEEKRLIEFLELLEQKKNLLKRQTEKSKRNFEKINNEFNKKFLSANILLKEAIKKFGLSHLKRISSVISRNYEIEMKKISVAGIKIKIPVIIKNEKIKYPITITSSTFDRTVEEFEELFEISVRFIVSKIIVERLTKELQDTIRKKNYLEMFVIPNVKRRRKYIEEYLSEREREEFSRIKRFKSF